MTFKRRIGPDPHAGGMKSSSSSGCPDLFELGDGDFAVIGADITSAAVGSLPPSAGCAPEERIVRIPRDLILRAKHDIAALA